MLQGLTPGTSDLGLAYADGKTGADTPPPLSSLALAPIPPIREYTTETFELGWTGVFADRFRVSLDAYHRTQNGFVSPLTVENPVLFLDGPRLGAWLGSAYVPARVSDLVGEGLSVEAATAQAIEEVERVTTALASLPLAVLSSSIPQMENGGADLIATYRNIDETLGHWGADVAVQWFPTPKWTVSATYSHVSENWFRVRQALPLALNAPKDKGTLGVAYRDEARGWGASARVRATGPYPFKSTLYEGTACVPPEEQGENVEECIDAYALVDVTMGYRIPDTAATLQVGVSNLFDAEYRSFVGAPSVGRLAMVRVRYDLF